MKAPEKCSVRINGYGAIHADSIEDLSVVLNRIGQYVVIDVSDGKTITYGNFISKPIIMRYSTEESFWYGSFQ